VQDSSWIGPGSRSAGLGRAESVSKELRELIFHMVAENSTRGAPRIHGELTETVKSFGIGPKRTSFRSPWRNGIAERWVGACRRDSLDHVIVLNERHLKRLMNEYVRYYPKDRTHLAPARETPGVGHEVTSMPRLAGLHHRYNRAA